MMDGARYRIVYREDNGKGRKMVMVADFIGTSSYPTASYSFSGRPLFGTVVIPIASVIEKKNIPRTRPIQAPKPESGGKG